MFVGCSPLRFASPQSMQCFKPISIAHAARVGSTIKFKVECRTQGAHVTPQVKVYVEFVKYFDGAKTVGKKFMGTFSPFWQSEIPPKLSLTGSLTLSLHIDWWALPAVHIGIGSQVCNHNAWLIIHSNILSDKC